MTNEDRKEIAQVFSKIATILSMYNPPNYSYVVKRSEYEVANFTNEIAVLRTLIEDMCMIKKEDTLNKRRKEMDIPPLSSPIHTNEQNDKYLDTVFQIEGIITTWHTIRLKRKKIMKTLSEYAKENRIHYRTAWNHFKEGKIKGAFKNEYGKVLIPDESIKSEYVICYARVSSSENRKT